MGRMVKIHRWIDLIPEKEWSMLPTEIKTFLIEFQESFSLQVLKKSDVEKEIEKLENKIFKKVDDYKEINDFSKGVRAGLILANAIIHEHSKNKLFGN